MLQSTAHSKISLSPKGGGRGRLRALGSHCPPLPRASGRLPWLGGVNGSLLSWLLRFPLRDWASPIIRTCQLLGGKSGSKGGSFMLCPVTSTSDPTLRSCYPFIFPSYRGCDTPYRALEKQPSKNKGGACHLLSYHPNTITKSLLAFEVICFEYFIWIFFL